MKGRINTLVLILCLSIGLLHGTSAQKVPQSKIQKIIDKATEGKLTGVNVLIRTKNEVWVGSSGWSDKDQAKPMDSDQVFSLASIGKMYTAAAALKLCDEKQLRLDDLISQYLPHEIIAGLANGQSITIRHLLGNTSGLVNYESDPQLNELYLSGRLKLDTLSHVSALKRYVYGKAATNNPGASFHYSSTNFVLMAMIMDRVTPQGHTTYIRTMLSDLGFTHTWYRETPPVGLVHHYGDLNGDGRLEDLTAQTIETTNWFMGDDGIYSTNDDAVRFLDALMKGKILSRESLKQLTQWNDPKKPDYGLGLMVDKGFPYKLLMGHSGRGIGTTTDLYYFPHQDMTVAIFCNTGIRNSAPEFKKAYLKMRGRIVKKLFLF